MARENDEFRRKYHRDKIYGAIRGVCSKKKIKHADMCLIEEELNERINSMVQAAYHKEVEKLKTREFIETRIKIKQVNSPNMDDSALPAES